MKIDTRQFDKLMKEMKTLPTEAVGEAGVFFKRTTPIDTGNARRKTKTNTRAKTITGNYAYAGKLDDGWSRQAPQGMSDPTIKKLTQIIDDLVGRL
mgnify:CR=1 FL=1|tara:strand:+ start:3652 stop:3939 length:288 start_codon:yes stop_codon:yes gene_type:complete